MTQEPINMEGKIDISQALTVFDIITRKGQQEGSCYRLSGIVANAGFDGYSVSLSNDYVELVIHFHNIFTLNYSSKKELMQFLANLSLIEKSARQN